MKRYFPVVLCTFVFASMLAFPKAVFTGASEGLLLWFQIIFPTLFPFLLITNLLLFTDSIQYISRSIARPLRFLFRVSENGSFAILVGFLCGYPMGAKITADLTDSGRITKAEGHYLLSFCNNTSPVFILNFIVWKTLNREDLLFPTLFILMGTPLALSFLFRKFYLRRASHFSDLWVETSQKHKFDFNLLDRCMMDSFDAIVKVGGYIILFSVLLELFQALPGQIPLLGFLLPTLEVTNGILLIHSSGFPDLIEFPAILALTSFGGFCSIAQTQCMIQKSGLHLVPYIIEKLATVLVASLLAVLYVLFF